MTDTSVFDFADFGASTGGSTTFAMKHLNGKRGIGVNLDPKRVKFMTDKGFDCIEASITQVPLPDKSVKFTVLSHVLEHLPTQEDIFKAMDEAIRLSTDYIFIQGDLHPWNFSTKFFGLIPKQKRQDSFFSNIQ